MAENVTIARPYAEAAFESASAAGALEAWSETLERLAAIVTDDAMRAQIQNPNLSSDQVSELVLDVAGTELSDEQRNFVRILVDNERLLVVPEIRDLFARKKNQYEGVKEASVETAFPLDDGAMDNLRTLLAERFNSDIKLSVKVEPELIGGVKVTVGDEVIDASVRGKLAGLAAALKS